MIKKKLYFQLCIIYFFLIILIQSAYASDQNILSIADIHFDPFTSCGKQKPCILVRKLQSSPVSQWEAIFLALDHDPPAYGKDTNFALLALTLKQIDALAQSKPIAFGLFLGDFVGHEFKRKYRIYSGDHQLSGYQQFLGKTLEFLLLQFKLHLPHCPFYPVIGNNDTDKNDYVSNPNGKFIKQMAQLFAPFLDFQADHLLSKAFARSGYYAGAVPGENKLFIITLNTNYFANKNVNKNIFTKNAAKQELVWLKKTLAMVKKNNAHAFIIMHIPLGIDVYAFAQFKLFSLLALWQPAYSLEFQQIVKDNASQINAIFAAHLHSEWLQAFAFNKIQGIPFYGTPSISPIFWNDPSFRVFSYNPQTGKMVKAITYAYSLNQRSWSVK